MSVVMFCRECGAKVRTSAEQVGKLAKCPKCSVRFRVPAADQLEADGRIPAEAIVTADDPVKKSPGAEAKSNPLDGALWSMRTPQGETYGPISKAELDNWVAQNRVGPQFELRQGEGPWLNAGSIYPQLAAPASRSPTPGPSGFGQPTAGPSGGFPPQPGHTSFGGPQGGPNPFSDNPYASPTAPQYPGSPGHGYYVKPHRGGLILTLAIVGLCVCVISSIVAVIFSHQDLEEMARGQMDRSGEGLTRAGQIVGYISIALFVVGIFLQIILAVAEAA